MSRHEQIKNAYKPAGTISGFYDGMKVYTAEQIESALRTAGFSEVKSQHHPKNPWITVLAKK